MGDLPYEPYQSPDGQAFLWSEQAFRATVTARGNESFAVLRPAQQSPVHLFPATTARTTGRTLVARVVFAFLKFKMTETTLTFRFNKIRNFAVPCSHYSYKIVTFCSFELPPF